MFAFTTIKIICNSNHWSCALHSGNKELQGGSAFSQDGLQMLETGVKMESGSPTIAFKILLLVKPKCKVKNFDFGLHLGNKELQHGLSFSLDGKHDL